MIPDVHEVDDNIEQQRLCLFVEERYPMKTFSFSFSMLDQLSRKTWTEKKRNLKKKEKDFLLEKCYFEDCLYGDVKRLTALDSLGRLLSV